MYRCPECNRLLNLVDTNPKFNKFAHRVKLDVDKIDEIWDRLLETGDSFYCVSCDKTWSDMEVE